MGKQLLFGWELIKNSLNYSNDNHNKSKCSQEENTDG